MSRYIIKKRRGPKNKRWPFWVWDTKHKEYTIGFQTEVEALDQCLDWQRADERKKGLEEYWAKKDTRLLEANKRRALFLVINGGAA